jgi:hypothetical protein
MEKRQMAKAGSKLSKLADAVLRDHHHGAKAAEALAVALLEPPARDALTELCADYLRRHQIKLKPAGRRREGAHRRTAAIAGEGTKRGAVAAMKAVASEIFDRKIRGAGPLGKIHMHELRAIAARQADVAAGFLQRGYDDVVEAILCTKLSEYCVAANPFACVSDVVPAKVATAALTDAQIAAAEFIRDHSAKFAEDLKRGGKAAEMAQP